MMAGAHEQTDIPAEKIRNRPADNETLKRRGALTICLDLAMTQEAAPIGKRGRQSEPARRWPSSRH